MPSEYAQQQKYPKYFIYSCNPQSFSDSTKTISWELFTDRSTRQFRFWVFRNHSIIILIFEILFQCSSSNITHRNTDKNFECYNNQAFIARTNLASTSRIDFSLATSRWSLNHYWFYWWYWICRVYAFHSTNIRQLHSYGTDMPWKNGTAYLWY